MSHWNNKEFWSLLDAPLIPPSSVIDQFKTLIGDSKSAVVLGCTKQLYEIAPETTVIELNQNRIDLIPPPGKVICGDWLNLAFHLDSKVDAIVGDGSLNCLQFYKDWVNVIQHCSVALRPKGKFAVRVFETPKHTTLSLDIVAGIENYKFQNFSELKWTLAMYLSYGSVNVPVKQIRNLFYALFDKEILSKHTGWHMDRINTIDVYKDSDCFYSFPDENMIRSVFPNAVRYETTGYPLAECCPIYVFEK